MQKNESKFWKQIREHKCEISWTRLENSAAHGTPDLLGYNKYNKFFTVELNHTYNLFESLTARSCSHGAISRISERRGAHPPILLPKCSRNLHENVRYSTEGEIPAVNTQMFKMEKF